VFRRAIGSVEDSASLARWATFLRVRVAGVIPALDEAERIVESVLSARAQGVEVVVAAWCQR